MNFGLDFDGTFCDGMALMIDPCTSEHAGETPDAFFHSIKWMKRSVPALKKERFSATIILIRR